MTEQMKSHCRPLPEQLAEQLTDQPPEGVKSTNSTYPYPLYKMEQTTLPPPTPPGPFYTDNLNALGLSL